MLSVIGLLAAGFGLGGTPNDTAITASPTQKPICRMINPTGSRVKKMRVCMTAAEWELHNKELQDNWRSAQTYGDARSLSFSHK